MEPKKQKKSAPSRPSAPIRWEFGPDIPTYDFFEDGPLDDETGLEEAVEKFLSYLKEDRFLLWEAVVCEEQGIPLTAGHKKMLRGLLDFTDEGDDQILYVDEIPRPSEPWYVILKKIAPHLLIEQFNTSEVYSDVQCEGWNEIRIALHKHGKGLSLPPGVQEAIEVVPVEIRHKLCLQFCFSVLCGWEPTASLSLEDDDEKTRFEYFIGDLRAFKDSVAYFALTLDSLLTRVILPENVQSLFVSMMQEKLGLSSTHELIADHL